MENNNIVLLFEKYSNMVLRIAFTYIKNIHDAEDICQKVFIKIYIKNKTFKNSEHEKYWIIRVAINACKDMLRSSWKTRFIPCENIILPEMKNEYKEVLMHILSIPIKYRNVLYLYYIENYSTSEIALILKRKHSTVRTQLKRGREILKAELKGGETLYVQ
ncbi:MAG: sigma-70 family RNA polymerase sigma factor [Clostridiales bacterium]